MDSTDSDLELDEDLDLPDESDKETAFDVAARRLAWESSNEYRKSQRVKVGTFVLLGVLGSVIALAAGRAAHVSVFSTTFKWGIEWPFFLNYLIAVLFLGAVSGSYSGHLRRTFDDRQIIVKQTKLEGAESQLAETGDLDLPSLWKVTHQRLDYYHDIATQQARQSFRNAQLAMTAGLVILIAATVAAVAAHSATGSIVSGVLGGIGATLASYIGRTFIRSQENAAQHLRSYFSQPLQFSRYLAAERLLEAVQSDAKVSVVEAMIQAILKET
jgi:hypothetical protein